MSVSTELQKLEKLESAEIEQREKWEKVEAKLEVPEVERREIWENHCNKLIDVDASTHASPSFWRSQCPRISADAIMVRMDMGSVQDYQRYPM